MTIAVSGISFPAFALGMLLIRYSPLNWAGCLPWEQTVGSIHFTLPDARRGSGRRDGALYRASFVDVLSEDYMRTARAKG